MKMSQTDSPHLKPLDVAVELPVIILHLRTQVVDHVVNVPFITILVFKELGNRVNLVPVQGFGPWISIQW